MSHNIKVLLVEDDPADSVFIQKLLQSHPSQKFHIQNVDQLHSALSCLCQDFFDVILLDLSLPDSTGLKSLHTLCSKYPDRPIIVMTGLNDENIGLQAVRDGAEDYLVKTQISLELLHKTIIYSCERKREKNKKQNLNHTLLAMRGINQAISQEKPIIQLMPKICDSLLTSKTCRHAWAVLFDTKHTLTFYAERGVKKNFKTLLNKLNTGDYPYCIKKTLQSDKNLFSTEIIAENCQNCPICPDIYSKGVINIKIGNPDEHFGIMSVMVSQNYLYDQESVRLLQEIGHDISHALHTIAVEQRRVKADQAFLESERKLSTLLNNLPGMAYRSMNDKKCTMKFLSSGCNQLTGHDAEALLNNSEIAFINLVHPEDRNQMQEKVMKALAAEKPYQLSYRIIDANKQEKWVWDHGRAIKDEKGKLVALEGFITDITARVLADQELERAREQLELALDAGEHGFWDWDLPSDTLYFSPRYFTMLGYQPHELPMTKETWLNLIHPEDRINALPKIIRLVQKLEPFAIEYRMKTRNGKWKWISVRGKAYGVNKLGQPSRAVGIHVDISEKKLAEEEKNRMQKQKLRSQKLETIGTLAGGIAHDFNNILTPIVGYSDMALNTLPQDHPIYPDLQVILQGANRAKDLVSQILTFSRNMEKEKELLSPHLIVNEAIKLLRPSIPSSVEINHFVDNTCPPIFADPTQIHQIVVNLVTNAFQAMDDKHGEITVELRQAKMTAKLLQEYPSLRNGTFVSLRITDNGRGMEDQVLERIYEPFFSTKGLEEGTGMGLSVVHGIVKSHQGEIIVETEKDHGTSFTIFFPAATNKVTKKKAAKEIIPSGTESILIVDDELEVMIMINKVLSRLGYKVTIEKSSERALAIFRQKPNQFDLVLTDLTMPGMTGGELLKEIKKIRPQIPIFIMTGYGSQQKKEELKRLKVDKIIGKPLNLPELGRALRDAFDKNQKNSKTNYFNIESTRN